MGGGLGDTHCTSAGIGGAMVLVAIKVNLSKADTRCNVGKLPPVRSSKESLAVNYQTLSGPKRV